MNQDNPEAAEVLRQHLLVLRCQAGDEHAFTQLMGAFGDRTLRYLRGLLGDEADDVQQEVWLTVYRGLSSLANPGAFRTWLFRATRHRAIDFLRQRKRERELLQEIPAEELESTPAVAETDATRIDPSEMRAVLAGLPPPQREVLLLRYQDDLSYEEIAMVVGCPIGTVRTRLHHAKRKLRQLIDRGQP